MGKITVLSADNLTLAGTPGAGLVIGAIQTAAAAAAASRIRTRRIQVTQRGTATSQQLGIAFSTRDTAGTLTMTSSAPKVGTGQAPSGISGSAAPAGGQARSGVASSTDSGGTYTDLWFDAFNNLNGYQLVPTEAELDYFTTPASTLITVRLTVAPTTLTGWVISWSIEELS